MIYDVFASGNSRKPKIEFRAWTSYTRRAMPISRVKGEWVMRGSPNHRLVATVLSEGTNLSVRNV